MDWYNLTVSALVSLFSAFIFWILTFKISLTDIAFSSKLEKSKSSLGRPYHRYRVRIANLGLRDLIEISIVARLEIDLGDRSGVTQLAVGNQGFSPILRHCPLSCRKETVYSYTVTLFPSEVTRGELSKTFYRKRIRTLAAEGKISLDDIFDEYGDKVTITLYLYGNDKTTGARRLFVSPAYSQKDVCEGRFIRSRKIQLRAFDGKKARKRKLFQIDPIDKYSQLT